MPLAVIHTAESQESHTIPQKAGSCALVQAHKTKILDDPHSPSFWDRGRAFRHLALNLQPNLNDLKWVCEDLACSQ